MNFKKREGWRQGGIGLSCTGHINILLCSECEAMANRALSELIGNVQAVRFITSKTIRRISHGQRIN